MTYPLPLWTVASIFTVVIQEILIGIASEFSWQVDAGFEAVTIVGSSCALIDVKTVAAVCTIITLVASFAAALVITKSVLTVFNDGTTSDESLIFAFIDINAGTGSIRHVSISTNAVVVPIAISALLSDWIARIIIVNLAFVNINAIFRMSRVLCIAWETVAYF